MENNTQNHVSFKTLIARINRKLTHDGERLRSRRGRSGGTPRHSIVDGRNAVTWQGDDLEGLGRELGVLLPGEVVVEEVAR